MGLCFDKMVLIWCTFLCKLIYQKLYNSSQYLSSTKGNGTVFWQNGADFLSLSFHHTLNLNWTAISKDNFCKYDENVTQNWPGSLACVGCLPLLVSPMRQFSLYHFHPQLPALCLCAMRHHAMTHFYAIAACIQVREGASNQILWEDIWVKFIVLPGELINDTSSGKTFLFRSSQ